MRFRGMSEDETRALLKACEAGAAEAARAFAMLVRASTDDVAPTFAGAKGPDGLGALLARHGEEGIGVSFALSGAVGGSVLLYLDEDRALEVASRLLKRKVTGPDERALAALSEVGNILVSAFLNGLSRYLKRACLPSIPGIAHAPPRVLLTAIPVRADEEGLVCDETVGDIPFSLCFLPSADTATRLVGAVNAVAAAPA